MFKNSNSLVKKKVLVHGKAGDYMAFRNTKTGSDTLTPREKKVEQARHERNKISYSKNLSEKEKTLIEEMTQRHLQFESEAKEQRKTYGSGPKIPKPGMIMRVYAKGKVNVGGMLAKVKEIAHDGKTVVCELTSGKIYSLSLEHLEFAKSKLFSD
ncbi:hypothetical protein [Leptospira alstonii]|uniref:Uncharacterized protein n=1 Tax=Leptospira alstonii serovar Sichuan str. 79601 TaxID=1218565 RepID=M6CY61_9LEPT|nr:hypothetical protein [Leptospira alstonii]AGS80467.1 hypothetical protein LEP1GSC193_0757 [Leptospira phage vB_LalZ_80412-LE1]EMJ95426.1 hypothetical protein LEP1GSC194_3557 [Leptospira alstonii serovar Sichuan str. 79601]